LNLSKGKSDFYPMPREVRKRSKMLK